MAPPTGRVPNLVLVLVAVRLPKTPCALGFSHVLSYLKCRCVLDRDFLSRSRTLSKFMKCIYFCRAAPTRSLSVLSPRQLTLIHTFCHDVKIHHTSMTFAIQAFLFILAVGGTSKGDTWSANLLKRISQGLQKKRRSLNLLVTFLP